MTHFVVGIFPGIENFTMATLWENVLEHIGDYKNE